MWCKQNTTQNLYLVDNGVYNKKKKKFPFETSNKKTNAT